MSMALIEKAILKTVKINIRIPLIKPLTFVLNGAIAKRIIAGKNRIYPLITMSNRIPIIKACIMVRTLSVVSLSKFNENNNNLKMLKIIRTSRYKDNSSFKFCFKTILSL